MSMDTRAATSPAGSAPDMTRPSYVRLSAASHRGLRLLPMQDYSFASRAVLVDVVAAELSQAALNYPLGFLPREDAVDLVGLMSLEEGRNVFVSASGAWLTDWVPASVSTYPFRYRAEGKGGRPALLADAGSGLFTLEADERAELLFDAEGRPTDRLKKIVEALKAFEKSRRLTQKVCGQIRQAGLLVPWGKGCEAPSLRTMLRIDEPRLQKLTLPELGALRQSGALLLIYAHLFSLAGLPRLMRLAQVHATAEQQRRQFLQSCFPIDTGLEDSFKF
jgi:hypothetical protein